MIMVEVAILQVEVLYFSMGMEGSTSVTTITSVQDIFPLVCLYILNIRFCVWYDPMALIHTCEHNHAFQFDKAIITHTKGITQLIKGNLDMVTIKKKKTVNKTSIVPE